jgi:hypothetical protein
MPSVCHSRAVAVMSPLPAPLKAMTWPMKSPSTGSSLWVAYTMSPATVGGLLSDRELKWYFQTRSPVRARTA